MNKILFALLAGITVGILLAPEKGATTRQKIADGFDDWVTGLNEEEKAWKEELEKTVPEFGPDNLSQPIV